MKISKFEFQNFNVDNQLIDFIDDIDNQLFIVKNFSIFDFFTFSFTLLKISSNLKNVRRRVFTFEEFVTWFATQYVKYWFFMNNFWIKNKTSFFIKKRIQTVFWYCKFWKKLVFESKNYDFVNKTIKQIFVCFMKMKMIWQLNVNNVTFSMCLSINDLEHNHTMNYIDRTKINDVIDFVLKQKIEKSYVFVVVNKNIQNVKWKTNRVVLNAIDENVLTLKSMHNVDFNFHRQNKDFRMIEISWNWKKQIKKCIESLENLNMKMISKMLTTIRFDKNVNHAITFVYRNELFSMLFNANYINFEINTFANFVETKSFVFNEFYSQHQFFEIKFF